MAYAVVGYGATGKLMSKVFGIGLMRTGTTSLAIALTTLGYDAVHAQSEADIHNHEASTDTPVAARYKELDGRYPGSKFILTTRDSETWLASCARHFGRMGDIREIRQTPIIKEFVSAREKLGVPYFYNPNKLMFAYLSHLSDVFGYFKGREGDLMTFNLCGIEGWGKLCNFLDRPIPSVPFPHLNGGQ